jgi:hypothetical protein
MAQLGGTFDSKQHDDFDGAFDPVPADNYVMHITNSSIEATKKKDGKFIKLEFTILEGEYKGRKIWTNLNIVNPNPVAMEIAKKELATLCRATGKLNIADTQELHGIPFQGRVKVKPAKDDWPAGNEMVSYKRIEGAGSAGIGSPSGAGDSAKKSKKGGVPWDA